MPRPSLLEMPCYSEDFSDTPVVHVVYRCEIRRSHRSAGRCGRLLVCSTLSGLVSCWTTYRRNAVPHLTYVTVVIDWTWVLRMKTTCKERGWREGRGGLGLMAERQRDRTVRGTTDGQSGIDSGDQNDIDICTKSVGRQILIDVSKEVAGSVFRFYRVWLRYQHRYWRFRYLNNNFNRQTARSWRRGQKDPSKRRKPLAQWGSASTLIITCRVSFPVQTQILCIFILSWCKSGLKTSL